MNTPTDPTPTPTRSSLRFELVAMALVVLMAGVSVFATFGSARSSDIVFCQLADGEVVVGVTTDCIGARPAAVSAGEMSAPGLDAFGEIAELVVLRTE